MKTVSDLFFQPLMSEKSSILEQKFNEYVVVVDKKATKEDIKLATEKVFGVTPLKVRTAIFRKKTKRTKYGFVPAKSYKKAMIRLPEGKRLELK